MLRCSKTAQEGSKTASQGFLGFPGCRKLGKTTRSEELLVDGPFAGPPAGQPARRVHSRGPGVAAAAAAFTGSSAPRPTQPVDRPCLRGASEEPLTPGRGFCSRNPPYNRMLYYMGVGGCEDVSSGASWGPQRSFRGAFEEPPGRETASAVALGADSSAKMNCRARRRHMPPRALRR